MRLSSLAAIVSAILAVGASDSTRPVYVIAAAFWVFVFAVTKPPRGRER